MQRGYAQKAPEKLSPKAYYNYNDYDRALDGYLEIWHDHQQDLEINLHIATCYLHVNGDKSKAIPYLSYLVREGNKDEEVTFMLGQAYLYALNIDEALKYFNAYRAKTIPKNYELADLYISYCNNAKEMIAHPLNVTFENLGKDVNTKYPDYYPFIVESDSTLYYTARRETNTGNITSFEGYYTSDIYVSRNVNGVFQKSKNLGTFINTPEDEQCVYMTPNGKNMIIYVDNAKLKIAGDLFMTSTDKGKAFPKPTGFKDPVNTEFSELEGCITSNLNMMIISSDRPGGIGDMDLYMVERGDGDKWKEPINLGPNINTKFGEAFPVFDEASNTLYFASEGPKSMGGYDIFKSKFDPKTKQFGPAVNLGYPINTTDDNMIFSLAANKRDGYESLYMPGGIGDLDIYKVSFCTTLKGKVVTEDSIADLTAVISILKRNGTLVAKKEITAKDNTYDFTLATGKYIIDVKSPGCIDYIEDITLDDKVGYVPVHKTTIILQHPHATTKPVKNAKKHPPAKK